MTEPSDAMMTPTGPVWPTCSWLAAAGDYMPPLQGYPGTAERLLLLLHYGIDWRDGWVSRYRATYWDRLLPDRIVTATFLCGSLRHWWSTVAGELESQPRTAAERREVELHLRAEPHRVLELLRTETEPLLLRTRIVADAVRDARTVSA